MCQERSFSYVTVRNSQLAHGQALVCSAVPLSSLVWVPVVPMPAAANRTAIPAAAALPAAAVPIVLPPPTV